MTYNSNLHITVSHHVPCHGGFRLAFSRFSNSLCEGVVKWLSKDVRKEPDDWRSLAKQSALL